jgi:hypothetical protein
MRITFAATAAALALSALGAAPAHAAVLQPAGRICGFQSNSLSGSESWTVVFDAGPLQLVDEDDPAVVHTGTVTCSIVTTAGNPTGTVWASATSAPGTGYAALPPTPVEVAGEFPWNYWICTRVDVDGRPLYWHDTNRDSDGWWDASPTAPCVNTSETLDLRPEDQPQRTALTALVVAEGELDAALGVVGPYVCGSALDCEPSYDSSISFARAPGHAVLRGAPYGWLCTDVHSGVPVGTGSALVTPDPGVSCVPPAGYVRHCEWMQVSGYLAPATLGRVAVTSACGSVSVTRWLTPVEGDVAEQWSGQYGFGSPPWRCVADDDTTVEPVYVLACNDLGSE